jgi:molybdopterin molybdotransferase
MPPDLIPLDKALSFLLNEVEENPAVADVSLSDALGCVLAQVQTATVNVPAFDNSAMDGYAVNTADLDKAGCTLPVSQTIAAGHPGTILEKGTAARIFTGAPVPQGVNAVVIQENTWAEDGKVTIMQLPDSGENIRRKGHDVAQGNVILKAGHRLRPQDLGLLASLGIASVTVKQPLKVAIINTGDEVVAPGQELQAGQLYDSNSFTLEGLLTGLGMQVIKKGIVDDSLTSTEAALAAAAAGADCIITTGGVSVGDEDHVRQAVENLGQLALWKLAIKPGKPFAYGRINDVPFFGLPGNPVAVFVTFVMLVRPYLLKMQGSRTYKLPHVFVKAGFEIASAGSRLEFLRVRLAEDTQGGQVLEAFGNQGSSIMTSLAWADGLAEIPAGETVSNGQWLKFMPFSGML